MGNRVDVAIIGAGIIGACIAYQISRRSGLKVAVFDKGLGFGEGSTGASSSVCRFKYSRDEMVELARDGIAAYRNWSTFLGHDAPVAQYHATGALWLGQKGDKWPEAEVHRLGRMGVRAEVLDDQSVQERFPAINPCVFAPDMETGGAHECAGGGSHFYECDAGYVEPMDALQDVLSVIRGHSVPVRFRAPVMAVTAKNGQVTGLRLASGEAVSCAIVINAAGPWCQSLFASVGLETEWPLVPTRIQIAQVARNAALVGDIPVCADLAAGIYFRTQNRGQQVIVGSLLEEDEMESVANPDDLAKYADDDFMLRKLHALQHRLPGLRLTGAAQGYSGMYTINQTDVHPVVGETPVKGLYAANGFSGHGFKLAPAIGSMLAQMITGEHLADDTHVDPAFLAFGRKPITISSKSVVA